MLRLHYNLPPGDPRLDALTEEDVVQELVMLHLIARERQARAHPAEEHARTEAADVAASRARNDRWRANMDDPRFKAIVGKLTRPPAPTVGTVTMQRAMIKIGGTP